jgi:hypothetical protein
MIPHPTQSGRHTIKCDALSKDTRSLYPCENGPIITTLIESPAMVESKGTYKVRNEIETKRNQRKRNEINKNKTK